MIVELAVVGFGLYALSRAPKKETGEPLSANAEKPTLGSDRKVFPGDVDKATRVLANTPLLFDNPTAGLAIEYQAWLRTADGLFRWKNVYDRLIYFGCSQTGYRTLSPALVKAIMYVESSFSPVAIRSEPKIDDESVGLMQLLTQTARWVVPLRSESKEQIRRWLLVPEFNMSAGMRLLMYQHARYGGDWSDAILAYNAGSVIRFKSTNAAINGQYLSKVAVNWNRFLGDFPPVR